MKDDGESLVAPARAIRFCSVLVSFLFVAISAQSRGTQSSLTGSATRNFSGEMTKPTEANNGDSGATFYEVLRKSLKKRKTTIENICPSSDPVSRRVLALVEEDVRVAEPEMVPGDE